MLCDTTFTLAKAKIRLHQRRKQKLNMVLINGRPKIGRLFNTTEYRKRNRKGD